MPLSDPTWHGPTTLQAELQVADMVGDVPRQMRAQDHLATINGRYDFPAPGNLRNSSRTQDINPIPFQAWLRSVWANEVPVTQA